MSAPLPGNLRVLVATSVVTVVLGAALLAGVVPRQLFSVVLASTALSGALLIRTLGRAFRSSDAPWWASLWKRDYIKAVRGQRAILLVGCVACSGVLVGAGTLSHQPLYSSLGCAAAITFTLFFANVLRTTPRGPEAGRINPAGVVVRYPWGELLVNWRLVQSIHAVRPPHYLPLIAVVLRPGREALDGLIACAERSDAGFVPWARELDRNVRTFGVRLILRFANESEFQQALAAAETYGPPPRPVASPDAA